MGSFEDFLAMKSGTSSSGVESTDVPTQTYDNWLTGAIGSTVSAVPELFGEHPSDIANEFRQRNPWSGFATEVLPMMVGGAGSASIMARTGQLAKLEGALAKRGMSAAQAPIRNTAAKFVAGDLPFELGRGAIGTFTAPEENVDDLWGSVALNLAGSGVVGGGFGALSKMGGKAVGQTVTGEAEGIDPMLAPTFVIDEALKRGPQNVKWKNGGEWDENTRDLIEKTYMETPAMGKVDEKTAKYVHDLDGASPEMVDELNKMFKVTNNADGLDVRSLRTGAAENLRTIDDGDMPNILAKLGMENELELAGTVRFPRQVRVASTEAAQKMSKVLDRMPGMEKMADGNSWAQVDSDGMITFVKRVFDGEVSKTPTGKIRGSGPNKIKPGDKFIFGQTVRPDKILPEGQKFAAHNAGIFSKVRAAYRPGYQDDLFSDLTKKYVQGITEADITSATKARKAGSYEIAERLAERLKVPMGDTVRKAADELYDVLAPTARKKGRNLTAHRIFADNELRTRHADRLNVQQSLGKSYVDKGSKGGAMFHGGTKFTADGPFGKSDKYILDRITDLDNHYLQLAGAYGIGPDDLKRLVPEGYDTKKIKWAMGEFGKEDSNRVKAVAKSFENSELENKIEWKENFINQGLHSGPWRIPIIDDTGKHVYWTSGKNKPQAEEIGASIIAEAKKNGNNWKLGNAEHHIQGGSAGDYKALHDKLVQNVMNDTSAGTMDAVIRGLRAYDYARGTGRSKMRRPGTPGILKKGEEGRLLDPGTLITKAEAMENRARHRETLLKFAADYGHRERWSKELAQLETVDPLMHRDVIRKMEQQLGISGPVTRALDKALQPVLGSSLGSQPATTIMREVNKNSYLWTHAILNPSAALVNLAAPLMTLAPRIAYLNAQTSDELMQMFHVMPRFGADGKIQGITGGLSVPQMLFDSMKMMKRPQDYEGLHGMLVRAQEEGQFADNMVSDFVGTSSRASTSMRDIYKNEGWWEATKEGLTYMAKKSEQYPRLMAFNVGYKIARNMGLKDEDAIYQTALKIMKQSMYGYKLTDRSRLITGPLGSTWGLFKNFLIHYVDDMIRYSGIALQRGEWGPLAWMLGSTTFVGGIGATPAAAFADGLAQWHDGSMDSYAWMDKHYPSMAAFAEYGFSGGLGVSLQTSVLMPGVDPGNELGNFLNAVSVQRAMTLGKAVGAAWDYAEGSGNNPLEIPNIRDQVMGALLPRAGNRAFATMEGEYIKSMSSGYPTITETGTGVNRHAITPSERLLYTLGVMPTGVAREQQIGKELWKAEEEEKKIVSALGKQFAYGLTYGDSQEMTAAYNAAIIAGVKPESVLQSGRTIWRREQGDALSRYGPEAAAEWGTY